MVHFDDDTIYVVDITPRWWPGISLGTINGASIILMAVQRLERLTAPEGTACLPGLVCGFLFDMKRVTLRYRKPREFSEEHLAKQLDYLSDLLNLMTSHSANG